MKGLSDVLEEIVRCNKCGFCQEVCPTYKVTGREFDAARGRNRLLRLVVDGRMSLTANPELATHLYSCLLCGACAAVCPPGIPTHRLVEAARAELTRREGLSLLKRIALRGVLRSPRRVAVPARLLRFYQRSGLRWVARHTGLPRLIGSLGQLEGLVPSLPAASLRARLRARPGGAPGPGLDYASPPEALDRPRRARVAYFLGCVTDNLFPPVGEAVVAVLERNGYEVVVPANMCCGVAQRAYGDHASAAELARQNLALLAASGAEFVVSDCATCAHTLKEYPELLRDDPDSGQAATRVATKVREASQLLADEGFEAPEGGVDATVTYHDPCHLSRGLGVRAQPRAVLKSIPGLKLEELPEADWCCGGAGSYNLTNRRLSGGILDRKVENFRKTGATLMAAACPACLLQLGFGLRQAGVEGRVVHPVQVLYRAYSSRRGSSCGDAVAARGLGIAAGTSWRATGRRHGGHISAREDRRR